MVFNSYTPSKISTKRPQNERRKFSRSVTGVECSNIVSPAGETQLFVKCMLTGEFGYGEQVVVAHLIPCSTTENILSKLHMKVIDVNSSRNALFLSRNIELCFDKLQLSFVPIDILHPSTLKMQIWDESIRSRPIFDGSKLIIASFDGAELMLNGHNPFLRCLSYQAFQAWNHYDSKLVGMVPRDPPLSFGTTVGNLYLTHQ